MSSRNEGARAPPQGFNWKRLFPMMRALLKLQDQAADYVREAKRLNASEPDELLSTVIDAVARDYFRHAPEKTPRDVNRLSPKRS